VATPTMTLAPATTVMSIRCTIRIVLVINSFEVRLT
jgi:hypothetical protein